MTKLEYSNDELARSQAFRHSDFVILSTFVILFTLLSLQAAFVSCAICVPSFSSRRFPRDSLAERKPDRPCRGLDCFLCPRTGGSLHRLISPHPSGIDLRGHFELLARDAAQFEETNQRFFNQIVRTRCASGDSNDSRPVRQPEV